MFDPHDDYPPSTHRKGGLVLRKRDDNREIIVEPIVGTFVPTRGNLRCVCGAPLEPWSLRSITADSAELSCHRCHRVLGTIGLGVEIYW
jgi:hypothetical protein